MKHRILVVNGDAPTRNLLKEALSAAKHYVDTAETMQDAFAKAAKEEYDVLITEIQMPDASGIEVLRKFKQLKSDVCIIVVTAYASVRMAVDAMREGAYDYITKPFNPEEISIIIDRALERQYLLKEAKEKEYYKELSLLDGLTGVYNFRYFQEMLLREINRAQRYPQEITLLMLDIDNFKNYNDAYGHPAGDEVLKKIGKLFIESTRKIDFVARYGGEEFAIILPETPKKGASVLASRLISLFSNMIIPDEKNLFDAHITISIGLATYPNDAQTKAELIVKADQALYQAKKMGKNRVCLFSP
ncbi:MAG: diguanylate cyclase [Candidatus Omnitrophota bacterium]